MGEIPSNTDYLSGQQVGNYQATRLLGKGSMGEVYEGKHPILNRRVAIKVLSPELSQYPELVSRFRREARAIAHIKHPAIVEAFDFGTLSDGRCYYVMEYLEGTNLAAYMLGRGPLSVQEAVDIGIPLMEGLAAAHEAGFIHRDIKPDNIFLVRTEEGKLFPKLIDFGIAKLRDPEEQGDSVVTRIDAVMGTPLYMSPEQAPGSSETVGPWSDIYSTGATLYHVIGGKPPLYSDNPLELMLMHSWSPPPPLCEVRAEVPEQVSNVIMKALAKEPKDRFHSMQAFAASLAAAARDATVPVEASDVSGFDDTVLDGIPLEQVSSGDEDTKSDVGAPRSAAADRGAAPVSSGAASSPLPRKPKTAESPVAATASDVKAPIPFDPRPAPSLASQEDVGSTLETDAATRPLHSRPSEAAAERVIEADAPEATVFAAPSTARLRQRRLWPAVAGLALVAILAGGVYIWYHSRHLPTDAGPPRWVEVAAGGAYTCALRKGTGAIYCWGANDAGQLGTGDTVGKSRPTRVSGLARAAQISLGARHSCALSPAGRVWCWGDNAAGQLGTGDRQRRLRPTRVSDLGKASQIASGRAHTCALSEESQVWCWGDNATGQLGGAGPARSTPAPVRDLIAVVDLSAGGDRTCAVTANGSVWCWGRTPAGGPTPPSTRVAQPRKVEGVQHAKQVRVAAGHACALTEAGTLFCWGRGDRGQLGTGRATPVSQPAQVRSLTGVRAFAVGGPARAGFACAADAQGRLWCWGQGAQGQLGHPAASAPQAHPIQVSDIDAPVRALSLGTAHCCAVTAPGKLYCFGRNHHGQLGTGDVVSRGDPLPVQ